MSMNKPDFNKIMLDEIKSLGGERKKLLLHACCAPCSTACLERVKEYFDVCVLFYNPNIEDDEYSKRKDELIGFLSRTGWADYLDCDHEKSAYYAAVKGLEGEKEGGARCRICFGLRLDRTAAVAREKGFDFFATTLTVSPLKNAEVINSVGEACAEAHGVRWLHSDFKKQDGYRRSVELSKEHGLYRQNFCGCVYSQKALD